MKAHFERAPHSSIFLVVLRLLLCICFACIAFGVSAKYALATDVPNGFEVVEIFSTLESPASFAFSPDGRMFIGERINGRLLVASYNDISQQWELNEEPFYTFDIPKDSGIPFRHRSSGLRDIAFDPDFENNGYVYAFYMKDQPLQNRVVRIQASVENPDVAEPGSEELLLEVPFNSIFSSGSHNGGAIAFGTDGALYITTGDGWNGGDPVQSLSTFTGKIFRVNPDGSIPEDNPFYNETTDGRQAIYALGLRNPYSMSKHPSSGELYVNEAGGDQKASIYRVEAAANYGHQGYTGIGNQQSEWANASGEAGGNLVTGGAWYPDTGYWPSTYHGVYFTALWGSNNQSTGDINYIGSETETSSTSFASSVGQAGLKPVLTRIGPDGNLYYLLTDYESDEGRVHMIRWTGQQSAVIPSIEPNGGSYQEAVEVTLTSSTDGAEIRYTLDGSIPTERSPVYNEVLTVGMSSTLNARSFKEGILPSGTASAEFIIGTGINQAPVAVAGADQVSTPGVLVTLNGADSYDPDGDDLALSWKWTQLSGPSVELFSAEDAIAFFTPTENGVYQFELTVMDATGESRDGMTVTVEQELPLDAGLVAYWKLDEDSGDMASDALGLANGQLTNGPVWQVDQGVLGGALEFDGVDDYVDIGTMDLPARAGLTLAFWFRADDFEIHDARFISKASGIQDEDHYWMVSTLNDTALRFRLKAGGTTTTLVSPEDVLSAGAWHHVAAIYDGSRMSLYLDGKEITSTAKTGLIDTKNDVGAALGNQPGGDDRPFDGMLDDVRIYSRSLSAQSVNDLITFEPGDSFILGDPTGNGEISALDASLILQHVVGLNVLEGAALASADVSGQSGVSALDAALVLRYIVGLIDCLPASEGCQVSED